MAGVMTPWAEDLSSSPEALGSILHNEPAGHRDTCKAGTQEVEARGPQVQGHTLVSWWAWAYMRPCLRQKTKQQQKTTECK